MRSFSGHDHPDGPSRRQALSGVATVAGAELLLSSASAGAAPGGGSAFPPGQIYALRDGHSRQFTTFDDATKQKEYNLKPGETKVLAELSTPGIITRMWFTLSGWFWENWDGEDQSRWPDATILKKVILRIYWDGNDFPSIEAPIGDFFGMGQCEYRPYLSDYIGLSSGGFYCYLPMPFRKVKIEVQNLHDRLVPAMFLNANYQALDSLPPGAGRLHCLYNAGTNPGSKPIEILKATGRGHFVGCALSIQGRMPNYLGFLEAPEYFYIDSEDGAKPTFTGTGLEDYFNGGWYFREGEFAGPMHGVPLKDPLKSMISMYRFHNADAVCFSKNIRMLFQTPRPPERTSEFKFSSTAYWYAQAASPLAFKLPVKEKLVDWYRIRETDHQAIP
jgi:hypothetical protein